MIRTALFFVNFFVSILASASVPPDAALVHFDKSFYVSGEVVWFKLYLPASAQGKDFSVKLLVANGTGQVVGEQFLAVGKDAVCAGHYALPFDAAPGVYAFVFKALQKNGVADELLRASVPVYNDLNPWDEKTVLETPVGASSMPMPSDLKVEIQMESTVQPRQTVQLKIMVSDQLGHPVKATGSLSVTDEELCGTQVLPSQNIQAGIALPDNADWLSGIYKHGIVRHADGRLMTSTLIPVWNLETRELHFGKSANGELTLQLPHYEGLRHLQVLGVPEEPLRVSWDEELVKASPSKLRYTEGIFQYLESSRKRKKIYQYYGKTETLLPSLPPTAPTENWKSRQVFKVQDYERFPDLATFFQEVIWRIKFTQRGGRYAASMYNTDTHTEFTEPPLFLLDQKASFDADFVGKLDPAGINTIELLFDPKLLRKYYPAVGGGGVVRITTLSGNQLLSPEKEAEILALPGISPELKFPLVSVAQNEPALRPVVCWQPSVSTDKNGLAVATFVQSDDRSTFCAEVLLQAPDGRRGYARVCYQVK